ncbi:hypothetical protein CL634_11700 [bacterium]|nr:hypothetical protein [bacterium]
MENEINKTLIISVSKVAFYICVTVIFCFLFSTCAVNPDVIVQCEASCKGSGSKMKNVTARECECESRPAIQSITSPWVLQ